MCSRYCFALMAQMGAQFLGQQMCDYMIGTLSMELGLGQNCLFQFVLLSYIMAY